jgi:nitrogen fixation protein FixH
MMTRQFTGFHLAAILLSFFAIVIAVNMVMAVLATRTFGGTVVENSYVASQHFNDWLAQARNQRASGLDERVSLDRQRHLLLTIAPGVLRPGAVPSGYAEHPLGRADDIPLRFVAIDSDHFRTSVPLRAGRWNLRLVLATTHGEARLLEHVE